MVFLQVYLYKHRVFAIAILKKQRITLNAITSEYRATDVFAINYRDISAIVNIVGGSDRPKLSILNIFTSYPHERKKSLIIDNCSLIIAH